MDIEGKEFNRCETSAPIWAMRVVTKQQLESPTTGQEEVDSSIVKNDVGVFSQQ